MRIQDIEVGKSYRLRTSPTYGWVKVFAKLKPKEGINKNTFSVVACEHTVNKNDTMGLIKYYRPCDMVKE